MHAIKQPDDVGRALAIREDLTDRFHFGDVVAEDVILQLAKEIMEKRFDRGTKFTDVATTKNYLIHLLANKPNESFWCIFMNSQHQILGIEEMFKGTIDAAAVYPRVIIGKALEYNAAAVILAHNHPSGHPEPSEADKAITKRIRDVLGQIDVRLLDHFIIGGTEAVSFAERGLL